LNKVKKIIIYAVNALLLILIGICLIKIHSYGNVLLSQKAADFWAGDSDARFAQVSCFFPVDAKADVNAVSAFRATIDKKLTDAGTTLKTEGETWTDAYSAEGKVTVTGERTSSEATAIGVGGNFFLFHPYTLISGSYIGEDDIMKDRVVLDYELAWKLFGGASLEGMTVTIDGVPYYVAGVVRRETDKFSLKAFSGQPVIYMAYSTLAALDENTGIDCYEIAMPDPISNFAKTFVQDSFKSANGVAVENSTRYSFTSISGIFKNFGSRSMATTGVIYPYWENAARVTEVYIARLYVFVVLLGIFPFICLVVLAVLAVKWLTAKLKLLKFELWDAWDDRYAREAAWKEHRRQRRLKGDSTRAKAQPRKPKRAARRAKSNGQEPKVENELNIDVESIVREIMSEMENAEIN